MKPGILEFPLPTKDLPVKIPPNRRCIAEIEYIIDRAKDIKTLPIILSFKYRGVFELKRIDGHYIIKVKYKDAEYGFIIKS